MAQHAFVIPFRDRGIDPLRQANLDYVIAYLSNLDLGPVHVVTDGRTGDAQFNRSAAYNNGAAMIDADVITYHEADMIVPKAQLAEAIYWAGTVLGLIVPFTMYYYMSEHDSAGIRNRQQLVGWAEPESIMDDNRSIGAVNTLSRSTVDAIGGWDEVFEGSWYDDRAMACAFNICCGPTRFVPGVARHLYHLPGWSGNHLTEQDIKATQRNKARLRLYQRARTPERIRELTKEGAK